MLGQMSCGCCKMILFTQWRSQRLTTGEWGEGTICKFDINLSQKVDPKMLQSLSKSEDTI